MPKPYTIFPDHSSARLRAAWLAAALVALMLGAPEATRSASAQEIGTLLTASPGYSKVLAPDELLSALQKGGGSAPVIVNLKSRSKTPKTVNWKDKAAVAALKSEAKAVEDQVIAKLDPAKSKIRHQFPLQAGFSCEITEDALAELLVDPLVNSVEPVLFLEPHLRQGIPLMNSFEARASFDGSGVAVAICDTGVDVNHPKLGGGGFPNAKVVAGFDYGNNDGDPRPGPVAPGNAHGTSVAAITAGDPGSVGDYIGGVAPKALIVAYKISTDADNLAPNDAIIAAWNNAAERNTLGGGVAGGVPIVAMNTSFGGGQFFANCDGESAALTDAADAATGAGITLFVSSGNNGFCSSMASPACLSQVISVGAVYDANIGAPGFCISQASCLPTNPNAGCPTGEGLYFEPSTKADQVTAYSNSALFLGLLAPSHNAYTADIVGSGGSTSGDYTTNFGGTSAAAPYATGAAAIIQSAALELLGRLLSVDELTNLILDTGDDITDQRNSLTTPRVNIGRAIEVLLAEEPTPTASGPSPTPTPFVDCNTIFPIRGEYFDPENDVTVDLYMEPFSKFIALANEDVEQASDPERIREDALSIPAYIASQVLPPNTQTLEIVTGIFLPEGEGFLEYDLACAQLQPLVNNDLLLFGEPYVILAVYSDLVPRSGDGVSPPEVVYFGTFSPGTFLFDPSDFEPKPSPTPTHTPLPNEVSLELDTAVDPDTELPLDPELRAAELLDISWFAQVFLPNATLTLYFDRNDHLEIRGPLNEHLRTVTAGEGQDASAVVSLGETIVNDGLSGFDFGPIDLTSDPRFPPPPPTGKIQIGSFNPDSFRWDFSQIPAGRFFIYGILDNTNGQRVVDYAPYAILAKAKRWPVLIGTAVDDRFVHGVAIHDLVTSASELDVVAVAQSGVLRVLDFLGRSWGQYSVDLDVTVDTAPAAAELDGDEELEILLGTDQLVSDENPIFANRNALLAIDANFRPKYEALRTAAGAQILDQTATDKLVRHYDLRNAIHFLPEGHAVFHTPSIRDMDGDGVKEVLVVTRSLIPGGDSLIQTVSFDAVVTATPTVETTTLAPGAGFLGAPAVGNLDNNPDDFEVVVGSQSGRIYVFDPDSATIGAPILTLPGPTLRSAALVDVDGDGIEEIVMAVSERDRMSQARTELHFFRANGQPVLSQTRIFRPTLLYDSLSTPVVSRLFPSGAVPPGYSNDFVALFSTRNTFVGINLANGQQVFHFQPPGTDQAFGSSSAVIGQADPSKASFEIVLGGGRDTRGNLFGWSFNAASGQLETAAGFDTHNEPVVLGDFFPSSILGSPEMVDLDGNRRTDVIYTNEGGYIDRFEAPESALFPADYIPADFPWPAFKHDQARTGATSGNVVPIQPFLPGDVNRDGVVDENDLFTVSKSWGRPVGFELRRGALDGSSGADDDFGMNSQRFLLRVLSDMKK